MNHSPCWNAAAADVGKRWKTLRDLLRSQGNATLLGSRDTLREAFRLGLIEEGEAWMLMIQDRNLTNHTYNRSTADAIATQTVGS